MYVVYVFFIRVDIALSALETFLFNGLHKFTLLTYLLKRWDAHGALLDGL